MNTNEKRQLYRDPTSCFIPTCQNNNIKNPDKKLIPVRKELKESWCLQVNRKCPKRRLYCCEDHIDFTEDLENYGQFINGGKPKLKTNVVLKNIPKTLQKDPIILLQNDMLNYTQYHIMGKVSKILMKPGCMPSKFACQEKERRLKRTCSSTEQSDVLKKQRVTVIGEALKEQDESCIQSSSHNVIPHTSSGNAPATETKLGETDMEEADINQMVEIKVEEECEEKGTDNIYYCDSCSHSIVGFRYTCVECENYDLCLECEMNMTHPEHCMLRIPKPSPADKIQSILEAVGDKIRSLSEELKQSQIALDEIKVEVDFDEPTATDPLTNSPQSGTLTSEITAHTVHHIPSPIAAPSVARQREMSRSETVRGRADVTLQPQTVPATKTPVLLEKLKSTDIDKDNPRGKSKRRKRRQIEVDFERELEETWLDEDILEEENRLFYVEEVSSGSHTNNTRNGKLRSGSGSVG